MDQETQIAIILERLENLKYQQGRLVSHFESEQRVSVSQGKRVDDALRRIEYLERQLEKQEARNKDRLSVWISILAVIVSAIAIIVK